MILQFRAPLSGVVFPIESVPDPVFSRKTLGNGIAIDPTSSDLLAPCDGQVVQIHRCHHALTLRHSSGIEILLHLGIDTVGLKGRGFKVLVKENQYVKQGEILVQFDADFIAQNVTSLITPIVVLNGEYVLEQLNHFGKVQAGQDLAFELKLKTPITTSSVESKGEKEVSPKIKIVNPNGLHARPAALLVSHAKTFTSKINLICRKQIANAKSLVAVMGLDVRFNDEVYLEALGPDAVMAINQLSELLEKGLGESEGFREPKPSMQEFVNSVKSKEKDLNHLSGIRASFGVAEGEIVQVRHAEISVLENAQDPVAERKKLAQALEQARQQLKDLQQSLRKSLEDQKAAIFAAHEEILFDPDLHLEVDKLIQNGKTAAFAWKTVVDSFAHRLAHLKNELLAARANDLRDVGRRVLLLLVGQITPPKVELPLEAILIAEDLTPSDVAEIDVLKVKGFCTVAGGPTSHVAILARALGIPALVAMSPRILEIPNGTKVILDADNGVLQVNPSFESLLNVKAKQQQRELKRQQEITQASHPATTTDGYTFEIAANIGSAFEAQKAMDLGADGVGLLRSEFLFLGRSQAPEEDEQYAIYSKIAKILGPKQPLIIRTLDVGGDKPLSYLKIPKEENPFLGERGIRVGLNRPEILKTQMRAILRAASFGNVMIMFPMISTLTELLQAKAILKQEMKALGVSSIPVGIMVEVPSTAIMADKLAPHVDFFSVGTNDLTQYTLAMDRGNPQMAPHIDGLDPSVLRLMELTTKAAKNYRKWVGVCGGIAGDPVAVPLLLGLGVTELSVSVPSVPTIKAQVRQLKLDDCKNLALEALECESAQAVRNLVRSRYET